MSTISSGTTLTTALVQTGDTTGNLVIKTGASNTTALTISGVDQSITVAGGLNLGTPIPVGSGGTGATTLTANNVLLGNGTSALQAVAPGTSGNILTSNGTTWVSSTPAGGGVTSLNGQTGAITNTSFLAIGSYVLGLGPNANSAPTWNVNSTYSGGSIGVYGYTGFTLTNPQTLSGTWRALGSLTNSSAMSGNSYFGPTLFVRIS